MKHTERDQLEHAEADLHAYRVELTEAGYERVRTRRALRLMDAAYLALLDGDLHRSVVLHHDARAIMSELGMEVPA